MIEDGPRAEGDTEREHKSTNQERQVAHDAMRMSRHRPYAGVKCGLGVRFVAARSWALMHSSRGAPTRLHEVTPLARQPPA